MPWVWTNGGRGQRRRRRRNYRSNYQRPDYGMQGGNGYDNNDDYDDQDYLGDEYDDGSNGDDADYANGNGMFDRRGNLTLFNGRGDPVRLEIASPNDMLPPRADTDQYSRIRRRARF